MYNCSNKQEVYRVTTVLPELSDAALFMQDQENKADFLRMLLNDFLKAHTFPYDYITLPENERLERYFGVKKSDEEIDKDVMESVLQMKKDKERLCLEMEYIKFYILFREIFFDGLFPSEYSWLYFVFENTKNLTKDKVAIRGVAYLLVSDLKKFSSEYKQKHCDTKWMAQMKSKEEAIDTAEALFIRLAHHWFFISDLMPAAKKYSTEQALELILDFIKAYIGFGSVDDVIIMTCFTAFVKNSINKIIVQAE